MSPLLFQYDHRNVPVWLDRVYPRDSPPLGRSSSISSVDPDDPALCSGLPHSSCPCSFSSSGGGYQEDWGWPSFLAPGPRPGSDQRLWWFCLHCRGEEEKKIVVWMIISVLLLLFHVKTKNRQIRIFFSIGQGKWPFWVTAIFQYSRVSHKTTDVIAHCSGSSDAALFCVCLESNGAQNKGSSAVEL